MYSKVGIQNISEFYQNKFISEHKVTIPCGIDCYRQENLKKMWMFSNIPHGSRVLDFGCGSGALGFLKNKNCELVGIDYSEKGIEIATSINGYDSGYVGNLDVLDLQAEYFDFIVSMDVFGHIPFNEKDELIQKLKYYLKPNGIMMHGIECGPLDYDSLTQEELRAFIEVDGHVGIESKDKNYKRFQKFFKNVDGEVRYTLAVPICEYKKQIQKYKNTLEPHLQEYILSLSPEEEKAFDIATGLSQIALDTHNIPSQDSDGGFLFLRASDASLPPLRFEICESNMPAKS